jgi:tetratricopeptide (TPR) repeat protein/tRNA A-37 threonylcarbamoyl transferase component Bud32
MQVETLFQAGVDLPPDKWESFLDAECLGDAQVREEVLSLLRHNATEEPPLAEALNAGAASVLIDDSPVLSALGPYRIEREIGRGGMAVVYLAVRADGEYQKRVAVKLIKRGMDTASVVERLRRERSILAALEHPSIARLLDGGTTPDGRPWIAMEYIEGLPIDRFCDERRLTIEERCALMAQVCDAVAYAHRHLVVHRDLKPSNILIPPDGNPKLLDFGIAKLLDEDGIGGAEPLTRSFAAPLTPEYASPEQIQGATVTTASDVYSLGVLLHEVLTGERPYRLKTANPQELERVICKTEPRKPSTLETLPPRSRRRLAGDLDNIVLMALRKDVSRRYSSAEQMADDIRRHLQGLPVQARRDTMFYRSGKFLRRNRMAVAAGLLLAASVITGTVIDIRQAHATRERFDQFRGFARTVLVDLHEQLSDIPGTAKARQALVTYVDGYLKQVAAQHAGDDRALATEFATTYLRLGEMQGATPEAIASFENGERLLERKRPRASSALSTDDSMLLARLRVREGSTLLDIGRAKEGVETITAAARLASSLSNTTYPEAELVQAFADWHLARLDRQQNHLQDAEQRARAAIVTSEEIVRRGFRTKEVFQILTGARNVLGSAQRRQGHWRESLETYQKVLADTEQRAQAEPASASLQRELARSHQILGDMVVRVPGHDENQVRLHVRSAIAIAERMATLDPGDQLAQSELAQYLSSGAETLHQPEDANEALGYLRRALPILETLLKSEPGNGELRLYAALTEADMGQFGGHGSSERQSIAWLRKGLADLTKLVESDPANMTNQLELIKVQEWLALRLARGGQEPEAVALGREAISKARLLATDASATPESWRELPRAYAAMASICGTFGKHVEERTWYRDAAAEWEKILLKGLIFPDSEQEIEDAKRGASANH